MFWHNFDQYSPRESKIVQDRPRYLKRIHLTKYTSKLKMIAQGIDKFSIFRHHVCLQYFPKLSISFPAML